MSANGMDETRKIGNIKSKKKRRKNSNFTMMYWAFVLGVSMLLSAFIIGAANDVFALQKPDNPTTLFIEEEQTASQVAKLLKKSDIIEHPMLFKMFFGLTSNGATIKSGKYEVNSNEDYRRLVRKLTRKTAALETVRVTIPEGYELNQIISLLVENEVCKQDELEETIKNEEFDYTFIKNLEKGDITRLEGYLYPDTYEFYVNDDPENVVGKMLSNFDKKFTENMRKRANDLGMTMHEVITLASIIEREATGSDKEQISSVFHNRLSSGKYPYLQSCATVQYALGERKARLTIEDTKIDSPYNTYQNKGLPPGPIANPGNQAIEAALYPAETEYLFFALQEDGKHKFSETYEEHLRTPNVNPN